MKIEKVKGMSVYKVKNKEEVLEFIIIRLKQKNLDELIELVNETILDIDNHELLMEKINEN